MILISAIELRYSTNMCAAPWLRMMWRWGVQVSEMSQEFYF